VSDTVVLIASCDKFQDVWPAASACLAKFWPDCPWKIYTTSGTKPWGENPITTGEDRGWVANLKAALDKIDAEFVLLMLEDVLLCREVDTARVKIAETAIAWLGNDISAIRLGQGNDETTGYFVNAGLAAKFRPVSLDSEYRISTSPTLWRVSYLRQILDNCGETAWEFEINGTEFSRTIPGLILTMNDADDTNCPIRGFYTGILRGKWVGECLEWLSSIGITVEDTSRGIGYLRDGFYHSK